MPKKNYQYHFDLYLELRSVWEEITEDERVGHALSLEEYNKLVVNLLFEKLSERGILLHDTAIPENNNKLS